jgi:AcrR family transcriptional regulator
VKAETQQAGAGRPAMRADARRNRALILEAAQAAFTEEGKLVPLDEIARRAGVGAGTVYRHFPSKEALFDAVFLNRIQKLADHANALADSGKAPANAFFEFLAHMVAEGRTKRDIVDAMSGAGIDVTAPTSPVSHDLRKAVRRLLESAQQAGEVRRDIGTNDIMALVAGVIIATQRQSGDDLLPERIFSVLTDGLRATGGAGQTARAVL